MKVLFVASEALPFIASGGLGDVAGSLPQALRKRLIGCRVVMPLYATIPQEMRDSMHFIASLSVPVAWRRQYCGIFEAKANGVTYYLLDNQYYFKAYSHSICFPPIRQNGISSGEWHSVVWASGCSRRPIM